MDAGGVPNANLATAVWANPTRGLTQGGALVFGYPTLALPQVTGILVNANSTTSIATISSKTGIVLMVGAVTNVSIGAGALTTFIDIIADGNTLTIPIWDANGGFDSAAVSIANATSGPGGIAGNFINFLVGVGFNTSMTVQFRVATQAAQAGSVNITALWAHT